MKTIQKTFNDLAQETNLASELLTTEQQNPKPITEPIDVGADELLEAYKNAWFSYPPLDVEYLIQTLNDHLSNCLDIRQKAQDLEVKAFAEANDQLLQRRLLESIEKQITLFAENEPKFLGNSIETVFERDSGKFIGSENTYWLSMLEQQKNQLKIKLNDVDNRLSRLNENGGGSNYVERFDFLKKLFEKDLIEAYSRCRAAALGLKSVYDLDMPVPIISNIGFLDELVLWAREATYALEKKFFNIRETTVAFSLHDTTTGAPATAAPVNNTPRIFTFDSFKAVREGQNPTYSFKIPEDYFARLDLDLNNPRLKGLDINIVGKDDKVAQKYWRIVVQPPIRKIDIATGVQPYSYQAKLYLPMATYVANIADIQNVPNRIEVNNVSPIGEWTIRIEPTGISGDILKTDDTLVNNLLIRMRIAHEKK